MRFEAAAILSLLEWRRGTTLHGREGRSIALLDKPVSVTDSDTRMVHTGEEPKCAFR